MSDFVKKEDAIRICKMCASAKYRVPYIEQAFENISTIDAVSVVHGEWIRNFDGNEWYWYCSNCKTQYYEEDLWMGGNEFPNYCPNCGARMKGADDE